MTAARATDAVLCRRYVGYRRRLFRAEHDQALPRRFRSDNQALQAACVLSVEDRGRTNESRATADDHGSVQFCSKADDNRCRAGPRPDPSLPHATNETVPSLWPDRGVAAQLLLRGPRAARADPLLSRYEAPSSFVWESSTKDHRFRRRSRLLSIATISPLVKPTPGSRVQTYGDKRHCADPDGQHRQFPFYFQSLADYFSSL